MAISKLIFNGVTQMDVTQDTVVAATLLAGETATGADGEPIIGTLVPAGPPSLQTKTKSYTPSETAQSETVTADTGYDGLEEVGISVGAISSSYVGSGITRRSSSDLSASGATVTAPAGYYASSASMSVASGTAGTPTATKGTVSNHSVDVTPSVTNSAGYITSGTKTGTSVTVSASELVSGTKSITANGTGIDVTNYASVDVSVSGGGGGPVEKKQINFIDYDGTLLHSYTKAEINAMTSESDLPANPSHTGLTAQGWNWTLAEIKAQLTAAPDGDVWVGQMYITASGNTEIDVSMPECRLSPILTICVNGTITVNWGDNTTPDTVTGTSLTTRQAVPHTYASPGDYTIVISVTSGSFTFYGSTAYLILRKNTTGNENRVYANCVQNIRLGSGITSIGDRAFYCCYSLASITIPSSVTSIGGSAFYYCYSLASITIPDDVTSIGDNVFNCCYSLASITIPSSVTSIGISAFYYCYSLASITIPDDVTSIGDSAFYYCHSLASITIPDSVTSIGSNVIYCCYSLASITIPSSVTSIGISAFSTCYGVAEYHFLPTTPPTLANTNAFSNIVSDCVMYVPYSADHSVLNTYKTASNWSTYASYMQEEPQ